MHSIYYTMNRLISQVYVHVDSFQHYLVAIVIPDAERLRKVYNATPKLSPDVIVLLELPIKYGSLLFSH